jgi:hypothetical protein
VALRTCRASFLGPEPLSQLEVLVVDCQATAAAPRGHLLEIGWARVRNTVTHRPHACLIALPDDGTFTAGYNRLCATHAELSHVDLSAHAKLLWLGARLWREGRRDRDVDEDETHKTRRALTVWTPELVQVSLEWLALRAALARRRAIWLTRLVDASVVWREPGDSCARLIVIEKGEVALSAAVDANAPPPIPPGYRRPVAARREAFTLASFDRLRVLTTELKRLIAAGAQVSLRLGAGPALDESRLASALWWV